MRHSAAPSVGGSHARSPAGRTRHRTSIDTGFYYDFRLSRALTHEDLVSLEDRMRTPSNAGIPSRWLQCRDRKPKIGGAANPSSLNSFCDLEDGNITQCTHAGFTDPCRDGHVNHTGEILSSFRLTNITGAHW